MSVIPYSNSTVECRSVLKVTIFTSAMGIWTGLHFEHKCHLNQQQMQIHSRSIVKLYNKQWEEFTDRESEYPIGWLRDNCRTGWTDERICPTEWLLLTIIYSLQWGIHLRTSTSKITRKSKIGSVNCVTWKSSCGFICTDLVPYDLLVTYKRNRFVFRLVAWKVWLMTNFSHLELRISTDEGST